MPTAKRTISAFLGVGRGGYATLLRHGHSTARVTCISMAGHMSFKEKRKRQSIHRLAMRKYVSEHIYQGPHYRTHLLVLSLR